MPGEDARALFEDDKGYLWFGTAGDFVARWDGERFTTFTNADGITGSWGWAIAQDRGGVLWIGSWSGGVSLWDGRIFQSQGDGKLSIALADVTGHAMEAAIPMVMFSGVLKSQIETSGPIEELFGWLTGFHAIR
ncbi:MAG: SpoIIE family protein phosphatase [Candidatus Latescibacteria bacterium]|nr:SpoIIE family protein phosphatase [Candidatus Latescibacterota bacterium]